MPSITVKNIPEDIYGKVKEQAAAHHRSINSEIIACLVKSVTSTRPTPETIRQQARRARAIARGSLSAEEIRKAIEEGRA
ncbi:MAG: Arc family DNA-binding protein [Balneolaceae bacterium]|nr:Arc family DNA-binding protein [Balneolaceae bacterium]